MHCISATVICGGDHTADRGQLSSPHYPEPYRANKECVWRIRVPAGHTIRLAFQTFEVSHAHTLTHTCNYSITSLPLLASLISFVHTRISARRLHALCTCNFPCWLITFLAYAFFFLATHENCPSLTVADSED